MVLRGERNRPKAVSIGLGDHFAPVAPERVRQLIEVNIDPEHGARVECGREIRIELERLVYQAKLLPCLHDRIGSGEVIGAIEQILGGGRSWFFLGEDSASYHDASGRDQSSHQELDVGDLLSSKFLAR